MIGRELETGVMCIFFTERTFQTSMVWSKRLLLIGASICARFVFAAFFLALMPLLGQSWEWANPLPQGESMRGVTYANGLFVAVGDRGNLITSPDGVFWAWQPTGFQSGLNGIEWCGNQFVAVGRDGLIATSSDGIHWRQQNSPTTDSLSNLTWNGSQIVAVGGELITSPDGKNWTIQETGTTKYLNDIAWIGNEFIAVGNDGRVVRGNGSQWQSFQVTIGGILLYDYDLVAISTNGSTTVLASTQHTFATQDITNLTQGGISDIEDIIWSNNRFIAACREGKMAYSGDGLNWTLVDTEETINPFTSLASNGELLVCVGESALIYGSQDGEHWTRRWYAPHAVTRSAYSDLDAIAGSELGYVAVGFSGTLLFSKTGAFWQFVMKDSSPLSAAAANDTVMIAAGKNGHLFSSRDGLVWTSRNSGTTSWLTGAVWGNGLFVSVGQSGKIISSPDGENWASQTSGVYGDFRDICWTGAQFIAVTPDSTVVSQDGSNWSLFAAVGADTVAGSADRWVAAKRDKILLSQNGSAWSEQAAGPGTWFNDITWDGQEFVAADFYGFVASSPDGTNWGRTQSPYEFSLEGIFSDEYQTIVVGWSSVILRQVRHKETAYAYAVPEPEGDQVIGFLSLSNADIQSTEFRLKAYSSQHTNVGSSSWFGLAGKGHAWVEAQSLFPDQTDIEWILIESLNPLSVFGEMRGQDTRSAFEVEPLGPTSAYVPHVAKMTGLFQTVLSTVNASDMAADTTLLAHPLEVQADISEHLSPWSKSEHDVLDWWPDISQVNWIELQTDQPSVSSMEYFTYLDGSVRTAALGLNAQRGRTLNLLHIATDTATFWTGLVYLNVGDNDAQVTESYFNVSGQLLSSRTLPLARSEKVTLLYDAQTSGPVPANSAWLRVESDQDLVGYELFGSAAGTKDRFFAGLQGALDQGSSLVFGQFFANDHEWTGYVAVNLGDQTADIQFHLYDPYGKELAIADVAQVGPHQKLTRLASSLFPDSSYQDQGAWVVMTSSASRWAGLSLWGDHNVPQREFLAGVTAGILP